MALRTSRATASLDWGSSCRKAKLQHCREMSGLVDARLDSEEVLGDRKVDSKSMDFRRSDLGKWEQAMAAGI